MAYLNAPNHDRHDSYVPNEDEVPLVTKNNANLANIIAAARPVKTKAKVKLWETSVKGLCLISS